MRRTSYAGTFVYVEGPSDAKFYGMFIDKTQCQIIVAFNRYNVIETCRVLESEKFAGVIGIIDADFNHLEKKTSDVSSVFQTDMHDCECFMLSTFAFDKLLTEFASQDKLLAWKTRYVADVRSHLLQQSIIIGDLLRHSNQMSLGLCFHDLDAKEYINDIDLKIDVPKFLNHVKNKSQGKAKELKNEELISKIQEKLTASDKIWQMIRGHDVIDHLCFAFRKTLGSWKSIESTREHIERSLRLAYAEDDFAQTQLFIQICKWEIDNEPYLVFRNLKQQVFII
jgi:hypothetical protein